MTEQHPDELYELIEWFIARGGRADLKDLPQHWHDAFHYGQTSVPPMFGNNCGSCALLLHGRQVLKLRDQKAGDTTTSGNRRPKKKPGRRSDPDADARIEKEYNDGLEAREWVGQADYLRKKHPNRWRKNRNGAKSWLCQLLQRAEKR
jgi:hypothetical protein